jgi:hypothetical protein
VTGAYGYREGHALQEARDDILTAYGSGLRPQRIALVLDLPLPFVLDAIYGDGDWPDEECDA